MNRFQSSMSRRSFIRVAALGGAALFLGREAVSQRGRLTRVHETRLLLGSIATITVLTDAPEVVKPAIHKAFARMAYQEAVLSRYQSASQVATLNRTGHINAADPALVSMIDRAVEYGERTQGAFDVTIAPVLELYRREARQGGLPDHTSLEAVRSLVDFRQIDRRHGGIGFRRMGMAITLDGIAKGYIIDQGVEELERAGLPRVLVEIGGDMRGAGTSIVDPWRIGVRSPRADDQLLARFSIQSGAVATSADSMEIFHQDFDQHHILNPHSGTSSGALSSVTVIAASGWEADVLSTALMVMDPPLGLALIEAQAGAEAMLITKGGELLPSSRFPTV